MIKEGNIIKRQLQLNFREEIYANGDPCYIGGAYQIIYSDKDGEIGTFNTKIIALIDKVFEELEEQKKRRKECDERGRARRAEQGLDV
jgi:hypothetical protein